MPESALAAIGVTHRHGVGAAAVRALDDVTLDFDAGRLHLVMGPSGSGKTTLLTILGCLLTPDAGEVRLSGERVSSLAEEKRAAVRRDRIGFVFQAFRLFRALSALENVLVALEIRGRPTPEARDEARRTLDALGIGDKAGRRPHELSGGEKQRVAIARALVNQPRVLLADEPTASLDTTNGLEVAAILRRLAEADGRVVVVVTHDARLLPYAHRVVTLADGRVVNDRERVAG